MPILALISELAANLIRQSCNRKIRLDGYAQGPYLPGRQVTGTIHCNRHATDIPPLANAFSPESKSTQIYCVARYSAVFSPSKQALGLQFFTIRLW